MAACWWKGLVGWDIVSPWEHYLDSTERAPVWWIVAYWVRWVASRRLHIAEDSTERARAHQQVVGSIGPNGAEDGPRMVRWGLH